MDISKLTDDYAVTPQILVDDVASIAAAGFVAIICNRPDDEEPDQAFAAEISAACAKVGLSFHHIPVSSMPIPPEDIQQQRDIIEESAGPVLAYCRSGQRSIVIWQASA